MRGWRRNWLNKVLNGQLRQALEPVQDHVFKRSFEKKKADFELTANPPHKSYWVKSIYEGIFVCEYVLEFQRQVVCSDFNGINPKAVCL